MRLIKSSKGQALVLLLLTTLAGLLTGTVPAEAALPVIVSAVIGYMVTTAAEDVAAKLAAGKTNPALLGLLQSLSAARPMVDEILKASVNGTAPKKE